MKICLINPPHPYLKQPTAQAPLGIMYVASYVRKLGHSVLILDLSDKHFEDILQIPDADLYGITGTVLDRVPCYTVAKQIKNKNVNAKVVVGGPISLTPQYLDSTYIDSVIQGEGESIIEDVINDLPNLKPLYKAPRIVDLDALPFPARDLVSNLGGNVFAYNKNYRQGGSTVIITSRGCPYNCAFCASPGIWGRKVHFRSVENVMEEVDEIIEKFGIYQLRFSDDTLTLDKDRLYKLCSELKKREVVWRASIRVRPNEVDMFKAMYAGGCREVSFGVESGDDDVLKALRKGNTSKDNYNGIVNAKKAGLVVRLLFMTGTPGETEKTADRNIEFLKSVHDSYDTIALTNFIPIPGSEIAENPERFNCTIEDHNIDHYNFYMWGPTGLNQWSNFISLNNLDKNVFTENKEKLRKYTVDCGKSNQG